MASVSDDPSGPLLPRSGIETMSETVVGDAVSGPGRVLVIEDDDAMRLLEATSLKLAGWEVSEASTGSEGLAAVVAAQPEVIICDRLLPDLDGLDVIAALARNPATESIPVVMVTGMGETDDVVTGIDAGAHDYLVKPFKMIELEVRCRAALRLSRQHRLLVQSEYEVRFWSERRRADDMRFQLAAIVESSDDAILSKTLDGVILSWNAAAQRLYGYSPEEIVGRSVELLVPPDRPHEVADILAKVRRGEAVEHFESWRVHRDGHLVPVSLTISPVRNAAGHVAAASTIARDITERHRQRHLARIAYRDGLTGLGNRLAIDEDMPSVQDRFDRHRDGFCMAMLDIDHFKRINDSYGHQAGDRILAEVGAAIASEIRPADLAYRYGGEEFLIVFPDQTVVTASVAVERIRDRVERIPLPTDINGPVTLSAGIAGARNGERYDTILGRADQALYQAKRDGRNQICLEPPEAAQPF